MSCNFVSLENPESFVFSDIKMPLETLLKNLYSKIHENLNESHDFKGNKCLII